MRAQDDERTEETERSGNSREYYSYQNRADRVGERGDRGGSLTREPGGAARGPGPGVFANKFDEEQNRRMKSASDLRQQQNAHHEIRFEQQQQQ